MIKDTAETRKVHIRICIEEHSPRIDTQAEISVMTRIGHENIEKGKGAVTTDKDLAYSGNQEEAAVGR